MEPTPEKYYLTEVDRISDSIYCHHDLMGELLIPAHSHKKAQFLYTEGGIVYVKTTSKTYFLPARHFMWIPAGVTHSIHPSSPDVVMRNLYFPVEKSENEFYREEGIYPANDLLLQLLLFTHKWNGDIIKKEKENYTIVKALQLLLPQICLVRLGLSLPQPQDDRLQKIVDYMWKNLQESLLFSVVAQQFGFSERSLHRLFRKDMGMSFIQFYTIQRILKALSLLLEHKFTVNEVARKVGYSSVPTFSNTFYKIIGQRPSEYISGVEILKKPADYSASLFKV